MKFLKNSSESTKSTYAYTIKAYEEFHKASIDDLVCEALDEQTKQVPHHLLKVVERIEDFQDHMIEQGYLMTTIGIYVSRIKTVYRKNRVDLPYIESLNPKQLNKRDYIEYKDMLTKDELRRAYSLMRPSAQARLMVMIQGGLSSEECEHLTTRAFIDELKPYHQKDNDVDALRWLADKNHPVIWVTKLIRIKTGKPYYAIIGAEAVNAVAMAKLHEREMPKNKGEIPNKLLDYHKLSFNRTCVDVNNALGLGYIGAIHHNELTDENGCITIRKKLFSRLNMISEVNYEVIKKDDVVVISTDAPNTEIEFELGGQSKLRPHMCRKFHATFISGSALNYEEQSIITNAEIDEMQGRGKTNVQDTYIKTNPLRQKTLYAKVMNNVSLWNTYNYKIVDNDVVVELDDPFKKNKELKNEVEFLEKKLEQKKIVSDKVNALRKELGDDVFKEMIGEILNAS